MPFPIPAPSGPPGARSRAALVRPAPPGRSVLDGPPCGRPGSRDLPCCPLPRRAQPRGRSRGPYAERTKNVRGGRGYRPEAYRDPPAFTPGRAERHGEVPPWGGGSPMRTARPRDRGGPAERPIGRTLETEEIRGAVRVPPGVMKGHGALMGLNICSQFRRRIRLNEIADVVFRWRKRPPMAGEQAVPNRPAGIAPPEDGDLGNAVTSRHGHGSRNNQGAFISALLFKPPTVCLVTQSQSRASLTCGRYAPVRKLRHRADSSQKTAAGTVVSTSGYHHSHISDDLA